MGSTTTPVRRRLDQEAVLIAAERVVDEDGYDALTMTRLAGLLGTRVSSLYHHVENLDDLRSAIQVRAMAMLGRRVQRAAMGRTGDDGLAALGHELRAFALEHPERYRAMTRAPVRPEALLVAAGEAIEAFAAVLRSSGEPADGADAEILRSGMAVFAALHGFLSLEVTGYFEGIDDLDEVYARVLRAATAVR